MVSPTVFARRSLSYVMSDMPQEALNDASQAQVISPVWHIASYLQAAALFALRRDDEAQVALKEGCVLESKKNATAWQLQTGISFPSNELLFFWKDEHGGAKHKDLNFLGKLIRG